ncbi:hypothetical protein HHK36_002306 [Tetracentron sinense]|uniref:Enhancer of mRNA-decapping protein 4 n=1 Tax=Tetracentron sinense TaxID=13715 RepID=A0A835DVJ3_TETSI|nr:hypothetical protein HHK36_002306 [Tetracentron sinense]
MASTGNGNPNEPELGPGPLDLQKLFKPSNPIPGNPGNPNASPFLPPPTTGPFSYPPPPQSQTIPFHHPYLPYPYPYPYPQDQFANVHHQRSISFPQPPSPNSNPGARLMALLNSNAPSNLELPQPTIPSVSSSDFSPVILPTPIRFPSTKVPKGRHLIGDRVVYDVGVRWQGELQQQLEVTPITKYVSDPALVLGRQIAVNRTYICYGLKLGAIRVLNINTALRYLLRGHTQRVTDMAFFADDVHLLASASIDGRIFVWNINEGSDEEDKPQITGKIIIAIQIVGEGKAVHPQEVLVVGTGKCVLKIDTMKVQRGYVFSAEEPLKCHVYKLIDGVQFVGEHDGEVTDLSMCQWMTTRLVSASTDGTVKIWEDHKALPLVVLRPHDSQPVNSVTFLTAPHRPDHIILITANSLFGNLANSYLQLINVGPLNREVKIWTLTSEEGWLLPTDSESWQCTQTLDLKSATESRIEEAFFNQVVALPSAGLILLANAKKNAIYAVHLEYGPNPAVTRMDYIAEFTVTMPILSLTGTSDCLSEGEHVVQVYCVQTQAIQQYALDLSQCLPPPSENAGLEKTGSSVSSVFDAASSDRFATLDPSHGSKNPEIPPGSVVPRLPMVVSSSESALSGRCPVISASAGFPSLQEFATSGMEPKPSASPPKTTDADNGRFASPPLPLSPRLSGKLSGFRSPSNNFKQVPVPPLSDRGGDLPFLDYSVDRRIGTALSNMPDVLSLDDYSRKDENKVVQNDISMVPNPLTMFKHPTHLITPLEILSSAVSSSENTQDLKGEEAKVQNVVANNDVESNEAEFKVVVETRSSQTDEFYSWREPCIHVAEKKEKSFCSQASDLSVGMARELSGLSTEIYGVDEARQVDDAEVLDRPPNAGEEGVQDSTKDMSGKVAELVTTTKVPQFPAPAMEGKKQKGKNSQVSGPFSPPPSPFNSTDSLNEPSRSSGPSTEAVFSQIMAMQEMLNQLVNIQKDMQKQMTMMVAVPVTKEGRRLEATLGRSMEKAVRANTDALWVRFQEENAKLEKLERDRTQKITSLITNFLNNDLPALLEKTLKKEISAVGSTVGRAITLVVEKTISSAIAESFQRGVGDKAVNQLEKSVNLKLEATVARQIQAQFQTFGKQALQDALRSSLEASLFPAFEMSCKAIFEQVNTSFQKGMVEHTTEAQLQFLSTHSPLALALRDAINSASSISQTLTEELADGQRKLLTLVASGANSIAVNPLVTQLSNGPLGVLHEMVEVPLDPTKELSRLASEHKFEEAFTGALQRSDVSIVSWLCSQVDLQGILSTFPLPLSQGVLLALLQQLACDISKETPRKLTWMKDVAVAINPVDPMIALHVRPIFEQVYQILGHHRSLPTATAAEASSIRLVMHVINSMLSCK